CGIVGILGHTPVAGQLLDALRRLEYRGYDSAGVATVENGHLDVALTGDAPRTLLNDLSTRLQDWTGRRWVVSLSREEGGPTLGELEEARRESALMDARSDPAVAAILSRFPGAKIIDVRIPDAPEATETDDAESPPEPDAGLAEDDDEF
ncbi:MAG: hypothetical protein F9K43_18025, partial [Bauldia sp.]